MSVCVLPPVGQPIAGAKKRKFRTFTKDLMQLRGWLKNCGVTEIAMESTGQYWRPLWNLLEDQFQKVLLVNPQHIKGLDGRKTDPKDAQWIAELLETGRLKGSWVPTRGIRELRDLTRQRVHTLEDLNRIRNRIEQLCQSNNIKVSSVATDLFGVSGRRMLKAIVEGKRDPGWMADYAKGTLRAKKHDLELALSGTFTDEQRWLLDRELRQMEWLEAQVKTMEEEIERRVAVYGDQIRLLVTIPGIDRITAWTIIAELGVDMTVFGDARHLASWAGLCPGNRESGGKRMSGRTRKANRYVKRAMCQAAWAASHVRQTFLSAFYRRTAVRRGASRAIMALAHHLSTVIFHVLTNGSEYVELGSDYYDRRNKPKVVARLLSRLSRLGYYAELRPIGPPERELPTADKASPIAPHPIARSAVPAPADATDPPVHTRKRGRPCKCAERGIVCPHRTGFRANALILQPSSGV